MTIGRADPARSGKETGGSLARLAVGSSDGATGAVDVSSPRPPTVPTTITGDPLPASTILVLETPATGDASLAPILLRAGYTVTRTTDPDEAFAKVAEHQLVAIDVGAGDRQGARPASRCAARSERRRR